MKFQEDRRKIGRAGTSGMLVCAGYSTLFILYQPVFLVLESNSEPFGQVMIAMEYRGLHTGLKEQEYVKTWKQFPFTSVLGGEEHAEGLVCLKTYVYKRILFAQHTTLPKNQKASC